MAALAAQQYGVVAARQLALSRAGIVRRVRAGRLHRLHRGVYAVGHTAPRREMRWMAAVLAVGDGALLSHRSAATLWRMRDGEGPRPDVTVTHDSRHPGIATHRGRLLDADRAEHLHIPVTSPARTLADLAHVLEPDELRRTLREAQFLRLVDLAALRDAVRRRPSGVLTALLPAVATQTELEDRFLRICARHGLPRPVRQHRIGARRYDFVWPAQRLVVETDGWQAHGTWSAFQADRSSANALQLQGWTVLRFTWEDITRRPRDVAAAVGRALGLRDLDRAVGADPQ